MKTRALWILIVALLLSTWIVNPVSADGIIIPDPPPCENGRCPEPPLPMSQLEIRYHHVTVTIENQVAITHVDQVFYNPNDWTIEGVYIFPLPVDAVVTNFTLWIDGQPVQGQVLDKDQARQTYEEIVRNMQDPALLEYTGRGAVQASIYPIPPEGERRIELEYTQALTSENGLVRYTYPLNTEKFSAQPLESVSVSVDLRSDQPIRAVYSPTHPVDIIRSDDNHQVTAGYEAANVLPDSDFALYYSTGETQAFHLLTYRDPSDEDDPDGFFLLLLAPQPDVESIPIPKDVILVLDHSGSMEGEKFRQAQAALGYILEHLNPADRFNVISFSTGLDTFASVLRPAEEASQAVGWVEEQSAGGSTDINRALLEAAALTDRERPTYLIFLTDGLPTEGETDSTRILENFRASAPSTLRLFPFGVGYDVDTVLLDSLAQENSGASVYVAPGEPLDVLLSGFYSKISTPVLTDLELDFGDIATYDLFPDPLPDLFVGSQIVAVGRYKQGGTADVTLSGRINGETQNFVYEGQSFTEESPQDDPTLASIPRLWATRKIGTLLSRLRLSGNDQETIDQIVHLSIRYGIVTPYTSYLVTEEMPLGATAQNRISEDQYDSFAAAPTMVSGEFAVEKAADQGAMQAAGAPSAPPQSEEGISTVRIVGSRTYVLSDGVWTDTSYDPEKMTPTRVAFLSDDYFSLSQARPELAPALALGERVLFLLDGGAYEIVPAGETGDPLELKPETNEPTPETTPENPALQASPTPAPTQTPVQSGTTPDPAPVDGACFVALVPVGLIFFLLSAIKPRR